MEISWKFSEINTPLGLVLTVKYFEFRNTENILKCLKATYTLSPSMILQMVAFTTLSLRHGEMTYCHGVGALHITTDSAPEVVAPYCSRRALWEKTINGIATELEKIGAGYQHNTPSPIEEIENPVAFGRAITRFYGERSIPQSRFATAAGLSPSFCRQLEAGNYKDYRNPGTQRLCVITG